MAFADAVRPVVDRVFGRRVPVVNVLRLAGVIGRVGLGRGVGLTLESQERVIERAFRGRLAAVALAINSPGGSPVQSDLIARRIREAADKRKVPVIAFAEDIAASGGYWLACAADEIYAAPSSLVGSIGVISSGFGFPVMLQRMGVERRVYTTGPRKGMLDPFRPEEPDDIERLQAIQGNVLAEFKDMVRARRGAKLKADEAELFSGAVWSGREALARGLVDGLGDLRSVMIGRYGDNVRLRPIGVRRGLLQRRLGVSPWAGATGEVLGALDEWAHWKRFGL